MIKTVFDTLGFYPILDFNAMLESFHKMRAKYRNVVVLFVGSPCVIQSIRKAVPDAPTPDPQFKHIANSSFMGIPVWTCNGFKDDELRQYSSWAEALNDDYLTSRLGIIDVDYLRIQARKEAERG